MRYFLFISLAICISACGRPYKNLALADYGATITVGQIRPQFHKALYRCEVNGRFFLKKFHLSGLLFFKVLPDSTTRLVFQNELGLTYFDFGWNERDSFQVNKIMDQMNKPALIRTLKRDFEILLVKNLSRSNQALFRDVKGNKFFRINTGSGFVYYIFDQQLAHLLGAEYAGTRRKITLFRFEPPVSISAMPQEIHISHLRAHFTIDLKKLEQDEEP